MAKGKHQKTLNEQLRQEIQKEEAWLETLKRGNYVGMCAEDEDGQITLRIDHDSGLRELLIEYQKDRIADLERRVVEPSAKTKPAEKTVKDLLKRQNLGFPS